MAPLTVAERAARKDPAVPAQPEGKAELALEAKRGASVSTESTGLVMVVLRLSLLPANLVPPVILCHPTMPAVVLPPTSPSSIGKVEGSTNRCATRSDARSSYRRKIPIILAARSPAIARNSGIARPSGLAPFEPGRQRRTTVIRGPDVNLAKELRYQPGQPEMMMSWTTLEPRSLRFATSGAKAHPPPVGRIAYEPGGSPENT
jgi:hypothetical protein